MKKIFLFAVVALFLYSIYTFLHIGILKIYTEYGNDYLLFRKKEISLKFLYVDEIGEKEFIGVSDQDLNKTLEFCMIMSEENRLFSYCKLLFEEKNRREGFYNVK